MANPELTVFEQTMQDFDNWSGEGEAPAYPLYSGNVVALVDRYPKFPGQVVIFPRNGLPGQDVGLYDLPVHERLGVDLVADTIARQMHIAFEGVRIIRHDEGYAIPDHPHTVLLPAARGEGKGLYEPSTFKPSGEYFSDMRTLLELTPQQQEILDSKLARIALEATVFDPT